MQNACLKGRIPWDPERSSQFEGHPERARWRDLSRVFPYQADLGGGKTVRFEIMCQPADGARAGGSDRNEAHSIHVVLRQQVCQCMRSGIHMAGLRGPHKGVVKRRNAANDAFLG